jgi:hypothetical protein
MALAANGHLAQEQFAADKDRTHGYVEIVELNDRAYFKAELLDINPEIRQSYVRYVRPRAWSESLLVASGFPIVSFVICTSVVGNEENTLHLTSSWVSTVM